MNILLFGRTGQVGWELNRSLLPLGNILAPGIEDADLADPHSIRTIIRTTRPDIIVNAAAYTAVDAAEKDRDLARTINTDSPSVMAEEAASLNALMVHYSTDYVYDGNSASPYTEDMPANPLNVYGKTKYDGDVAVQENCDRHLILRTSWVYASRGNNFLRTMIRLMQEKAEIRVVNDQVGVPTNARYLAESTSLMIYRYLSREVSVSPEVSGVYHITSDGQCSWYEYAELIRDILGKKALGALARIIPVSGDEFGAEARRPVYSVLDNSKLAKMFNISCPRWQMQLELCIEGVLAEGLNQSSIPSYIDKS